MTRGDAFEKTLDYHTLPLGRQVAGAFLRFIGNCRVVVWMDVLRAMHLHSLCVVCRVAYCLVYYRSLSKEFRIPFFKISKR